MKILIIRNDKLGDFTLSLPSYIFAKENHRNIHISVLVPNYTADIASACRSIDEVMVDNIQSIFELSKLIRSKNFDAVITLYSTTRIALAVWLARIPYRLAPATKFAQIFYNHRLRQRRSRSEKPEFIYNLDLVRKFFSDNNLAAGSEPAGPFLVFDASKIADLRSHFVTKYKTNIGKLAFIHVGSGGSANNLSPRQYASLARHLHSDAGHTVVLSAGPDELSLAQQTAKQLHGVPYVIYHSTEGLLRFTQHIAFADVFISGSTGPLHLAGALDVPTAAFYPLRRSATALRWQTLNSAGRRLAYSPPPGGEMSDLSDAELKTIADEISQHYLY